MAECRYSSKHSFTSVLNGDEWSASRSGRCAPEESAPDTDWIRGRSPWEETTWEIREVGCEDLNWTELAQNKLQLQTIVNEVLNFWIS
jgi:hypothetical protein